MQSSFPAKQQGAALIMVLMIVSFVAALAVEMSWRHDMSLARSVARWQHVQAENYMDGLNAFAMNVLELDIEFDEEEEKESDDLGDPWNEQMPPIPTEHGGLMGKIEDAQGRFNINSLAIKVESNDPPDVNQFGPKYTVYQKRFIRFLQTINISEDEDPQDNPLYLDEYEAKNITDALIDWVDSDKEYDSETGQGGAEADYYAQLDPPITIANRPMISITELRLVKGITPLLYDEILPFVIALRPTTKNGTLADITLNVNTMPFELVRSLNKEDDLRPLSMEDAEEVYGETQSGLDDLEDFKNNGTIKNVWLKPDEGEGGDTIELEIDTTGLGFRSDYFIVTSMIKVGEEVFRGKALIHRDYSKKEFKVVRKTTNNF